MTDKYHNKYRIPSARWQNWDYGSEGAYFITICTKHRDHQFGEINNGQMCLTHVGVLADVFWHEIKNHAKNVELDAFVVMPNHIHGILILTDNEMIDNDFDPIHQPNPSTDLSPGHLRFQNQGKNTVSSIIGSYKSAVTKHAHRLNFKNEWQPRFHDHVIRDDAEYHRIKQYIINNPAKWQDDTFNNENDGRCNDDGFDYDIGDGRVDHNENDGGVHGDGRVE